MATLPARRIRIKLDGSVPKRLLDENGADGSGDQQTPLFLRGNDTDVQVGLFYDAEVVDIANITEIYFELWYNSTLLLTETLAAADLDDALTDETWADNTAQHGTFELSAADLNFDLEDIGNATAGSTVDLHCEVTALMDDGRLFTLGIGPVKLLVPRHTSEGTPSVTTPTFYTAAQTLALFQLHAATSNAENIHLFNPDNNERYRLKVTTVDGQPVLTLESVPVT